MSTVPLENIGHEETSTQGWQGLKHFFKAGPYAWRGAGYSIIVGGYVLTFAALIHAAERWSIMDFTIVFGLILMLGITLAGRLVLFLLKRVGKLPSHFHTALVSGGLFLIVFSSLLVEGASVLIFSGYLLVTLALIGAGANVWLTGRYRDLNRPQQMSWAVGSGLGVVGLLALIVWFFLWSGPAYASPAYAMPHTADGNLAAMADPTQPGGFDVLTLNYGSGTDKQRVEYGSGADLLTDSVDATPFVDGWSSVSGWYRTRYWGFDDTQLPLNGQVWYPDGAGPFPLVLIVHGNHNMADFSEGGYAYLGELLASRGYIAISVDQNFLNGGPPDLAGSLEDENDARAWILLEHLRTWHDWHADPESPFYQKVDTEHIALIGQSRGGEAVAIAALFNTLTAYPDDAQIPFDYGFNIQSVIAIAPTYGQYEPGFRDVVLRDVNYLTFQGSADADNKAFMGLWQYENTIVDGDTDTVKSAIYIHGANHGQFNTSWGSGDAIGPQQYLLQRNTIMPAGDQEQIAQSLVSAFLDFTLKGKDDYRALFVDPLSGRAFLPDALLISQYMDSNTRLVADFEEDFELTTAHLAGASWQAEHLTLWRERIIQNKFYDYAYGSNAVYVGWDTSVDAGETPRFTLMLPDSSMLESADLTVGLAVTDAYSDCTLASDTPIDFHIELADANGHVASVAVSQFGHLFPASTYAYSPWKAPLTNEDTSEIVLNTIVVPMSSFADANDLLDPAGIRSISFVFDETPCGVVIMDDLGFQPQP